MFTIIKDSIEPPLYFAVKDGFRMPRTTAFSEEECKELAEKELAKEERVMDICPHCNHNPAVCASAVENVAASRSMVTSEEIKYLLDRRQTDRLERVVWSEIERQTRLRFSEES